MSSNMTLSLMGLYNYDPTIFENMTLPTGVSKDTLVDNLLVECAEFEILYPDADFMKTFIGKWSDSRIDSWTKLNDYFNIVLNPTNEYDFERKRTPNLTKTKSGTETDTQNGQISDSGNNDRTADLTETDSVSAYNSSTFENRSKTTTSGTDKYAIGNTRTFTNLANVKSFANRQDSETGTDTITEKGHRSDLAKLIESAIALSVHNIYELIIEEFKARFCLLIY